MKAMELTLQKLHFPPFYGEPIGIRRLLSAAKKTLRVTVASVAARTLHFCPWSSQFPSKLGSFVLSQLRHTSCIIQILGFSTAVRVRTFIRFEHRARKPTLQELNSSPILRRTDRNKVLTFCLATSSSTQTHESPSGRRKNPEFCCIV